MEDKNIMDLEDVTLNTLIETGTEVRLIFVNGYQETVRIRDYGAETLLVEDQKEQKKLVYIHAVSTINMGWGNASEPRGVIRGIPPAWRVSSFLSPSGRYQLGSFGRDPTMRAGSASGSTPAAQPEAVGSNPTRPSIGHWV